MESVLDKSSASASHTEFSDKEADIAHDHEAPLYKPEVDVSGVDERKLMRKIDFALIPWLSFLYLLSFLDRTSIGK